MTMDDILDSVGMKYEDLKAEEKDTLYSWLDALEKSQLTMEKIRQYVGSLKEQVEKELVDEPEFTWIFLFRVQNRRQILLKARLKNYMLLEAFLSTPERARAAIEAQLSAMKKHA